MEPLVLQTLSAIIFFGAGLDLLMALQQVTGKTKERTNFLLFGLLACDGLILLGAGLVANNIPQKFPAAIFLFLTAVYLVGPLNLLYYHSLLEPNIPVPYKIKIHIIPASAVFIGEVIFQMEPTELKKQVLQNLFAAPSHHPLGIAIALGALCVLAYLSYLLKVELSVWRVKEIKTEVRIVMFMIVAAMISVIGLGAGFFLKRMTPFLLAAVLISLIQVAIFFAQNRYPYFFQILRKEIKKKHYEKSLLAGLNTDVIYKRLMELMTEEKIYQEMDLNLRIVAEKLAITPHQLSQFLNERMNQSFNNFINQHRIEKAKKLLIERPDQKLLAICFEVGFSSKSAFNSAFKRHTGKSPKEFRLQTANSRS